MKKITTLMTVLLMAAMTFTFTSCDDEDEEISYSLEGVWKGSIVSGYYNRYGDYRESYTNTQIEFYNDPYSYASGSGREVDYNRNGWTDVVYFDYVVRNGNIYLDYDDGSSVAIYNWRMYYDTFEGEFHDYWTGEYLASFRLYYVSGGWRYGYDKIKEGLPKDPISLEGLDKNK